MKTHRLRWQLALAQATLALGLLLGGTVVLASNTDDLRRAEAAAGAQRDAAVLAAQVGPRLAAGRAIDAILATSASAERKVQVVDPNGQSLGGDDLITLPHISDAVDEALNDISATPDEKGIGDGAAAIGIQPILVDDELEGVVVVTEVAPARRGWRELYGLDPWAAALLCAVAAAAGWWLAGLITKPLARLTDQARGLLLSGASPLAPSARITEVAVLGTAIERVGTKFAHESFVREQMEIDLRRIAHELRTPLTTIRLRLDELSDADVHADDSELLNSVGGQLDRLDRLASQVSQLRHLGQEMVDVDVGKMATVVIARLRPVADWGRTELQLSMRADVHILAESDAFEDALSNVIENAIKHSPRGGRVRVVVGVREDEAVIEIGDVGPGIAPGLRDLVIRPGVRFTGSNRVPGTGQGLAIVAAAIDRIGGALELEDVVPHGTLVRMVLPLSV